MGAGAGWGSVVGGSEKFGAGAVLRLRKLGTVSKLSGMVHKGGQARKRDRNIPRHQLIQQNFALVFRRVGALNYVRPLHVGRSRRSGDLGRYLLDGLGLLNLLWLHDGHQRWSNIHRGVVRGARDSTQKRE